jgi:membrane-associated PAP2 superfamily phosphatase
MTALSTKIAMHNTANSFIFFEFLLLFGIILKLIILFEVAFDRQIEQQIQQIQIQAK